MKTYFVYKKEDKYVYKNEGVCVCVCVYSNRKKMILRDNTKFDIGTVMCMLWDSRYSDIIFKSSACNAVLQDGIQYNHIHARIQACINDIIYCRMVFNIIIYMQDYKPALMTLYIAGWYSI